MGKYLKLLILVEEFLNLRVRFFVVIVLNLEKMQQLNIIPNLILMIKIHCLQNWYNLGDLAMEEAIYDRRSFAEFLDLDLMLDKIPDETTILNFRHLLERNQLAKES